MVLITDSLTGYAAGVERKRWLLELEEALPHDILPMTLS